MGNSKSKDDVDKIVCVPSGEAGIFDCTSYKGTTKLGTVRAKDIPTTVSMRTFDLWSVGHLWSGFFLGLILFLFSSSIVLVLFLSLLLIVGFEVLEHFWLDRGTAKWMYGGHTETTRNTLMDVVLTFVGVIFGVGLMIAL